MGFVDRWWRSLWCKDRKKDWPEYYTKAKPKRVYCKECQYFGKEENFWYYMRGNGGQSTEQFNYKCSAPQNQKRQIGWFHDFKEKTPRYSYPSTPYYLNHHNDCEWFKRLEEESDWEVK